MIYGIYIAAAAVIGLLIGLVALSVAWLSRTVLRNVRSKTVGLLSVYDELLEEKSRQLSETEREISLRAGRTAEESSPVKETAAQEKETALPPAAAVYRDSSAGDIYRTIRDGFSFRVEEIMPGLRDAETISSGLATRLYSELDYDTVYALSTLQPEEQEEILRQTLDDDEMILLDIFLTDGRPFGALEFYDSLCASADAEPKPVKLRLPVELCRGRCPADGVEIVPDGEICEGFQVEADNLLYDYCIKARELR